MRIENSRGSAGRPRPALVQLALLAAAACAGEVGPGTADGVAGSGAGWDAGASGAAGAVAGWGAGASGAAGAAGGHDVVCEPETGACACIAIGMLGRLPTYGAVPGQDDTAALQAWLNEKSTAEVEVYTSHNPLTPEFLVQYDVLILQALEDREGGPYWSYTPSDLANLEAWVRNGGGVVTMTGYGGRPEEIEPTNQLLAFTGMSYNGDDTLTTCPDSCCYCVGNSVPASGWDPAHPVAANIGAVGAFHGRSVNPGPDGQVVGSQGGMVFGATVEVGQGRVFMFADEWVSYTSQWTGEGVANDCNSDPNHSCYGTSAATSYQVPQFWYNAILWASGDPPCFRIDESTIIL